MEVKAFSSSVGMYVNRGCLIVPIQVELDDKLVIQVQEDILQQVEKTGVRGVIIDISGVAVIDSSLGRAIFDTAKMASLLGAKTAIAGLRPGVVASLVDLDFEPGDVRTAVSLEEGFRIIEPDTEPEGEPEEAEVLEVEVDMDETDQAEEGEEISVEENGEI